MLVARTVALLLTLFLALAPHRAAAHFTPTECCFNYAQKALRHTQSFYETPSDCSLRAVVLVTSTGNKICADPERAWVKKALKNLRRKK
ncbi:C-C motif chemokine 17 [Egretta garzetta]|uniref:C-C motif chemokine 17 n=1 Tax=Egretta garzetta TaxID=188379 RepID=UPI00051EFE7E|nr:C-C motif chemokine 17 [Egretta garzetta]